MIPSVPEITPEELHHELQSSTPPLVIDVREDDELEISRIDGVLHIPLGELPSRVDTLDPNANVAVICHLGGRSAQATAYLLSRGFKHVRNVVGGMNRWAREVDPSQPQY